LLKTVTERLRECLRDSDTIGRFGGDEFNILVTQVKQESDISLVAHKILRAMSFPFQIEGHEIYMTCSIGIALYPRDCHDVHALIKNADTALYRAKDLGRNNYQVYSPAMNARALERMAMENSLRRVLERKELRVHYQAQVSFKTGKIVGMEALVRWEHEIGEMIQPSVFIPLAEQIGVIAPIGEWVLRTACYQAKTWQQEGFAPLRVGINVSAAQLQDPKFADVVTHIVSESKIDPKWINLEITESVVMEDVKEAVGKFRQLHDVGITLAIDDFGIGYSSLSYLRDFPVDQLKMDRSFVQNLPHQTNDANIARHIIAMAHEVGLSVIAEGVETAEQFEFLRSLGCNEGQGFLLSKPVPPEEFTKLLRRGKTFSFPAASSTLPLPTETAASLA
jgi:predicted signal transduction protein with EAL and GGDEF domain